ncbi:telomeric repeat binding protein [Striga asiatica]|uniref:Telomeric repeat binding protein n=1 Tax=Striga asiatica TaxID=4170 RepID=A0A5A7P5B7_STRAF|nr:telomeric repeat binding protein [Striga asiatica]
MDIDPDIANWILDFLLRQPLDDQTLSSLLRALPLANDDADLKKLLLLRKMEFEVSQNSISESTLDLLEQLEELEFRKGNDVVSDAMKRAYCAVAVECTVKLLLNRDGGDKPSKFGFFEAVKRIWRGRVGRMEKVVEKGGLGSDELSSWKDEMEAAVWEDSVCEGVVRRNAGVVAVEVVKAYLREEREKMGPSFLEMVAEGMKNGDIVQEVLGLENGGRVVAEIEAPSSCAGAINNGGNGTEKKRIKLRDKLVGLRRSRGSVSRNSRGAKIVDSDENSSGPSHRNYSMPSSAEVNRVREALGSSASELHAAVKDPLPDALQFAEKISDDSRKDKDHEPTIENNRFRPNLFIVDGAGVVQGSSPNVNNGPKPSLMERNSTAHTFEWEDSIDRSQEDPASGSRLLLPSPKPINMSPLDRYEVKNLKRRRKGRKWSLAEEDTLRTGVEKYGKGNWKVILTAYRDEFEGRTEVDLKDKWRNLTRHG